MFKLYHNLFKAIDEAYYDYVEFSESIGFKTKVDKRGFMLLFMDSYREFLEDDRNEQNHH